MGLPRPAPTSTPGSLRACTHLLVSIIAFAVHSIAHDGGFVKCSPCGVQRISHGTRTRPLGCQSPVPKDVAVQRSDSAYLVRGGDDVRAPLIRDLLIHHFAVMLQDLSILGASLV